MLLYSSLEKACQSWNHSQFVYVEIGLAECSERNTILGLIDQQNPKIWAQRDCFLSFQIQRKLRGFQDEENAFDGKILGHLNSYKFNMTSQILAKMQVYSSLGWLSHFLVVLSLLSSDYFHLWQVVARICHNVPQLSGPCVLYVEGPVCVQMTQVGHANCCEVSSTYKNTKQYQYKNVFLWMRMLASQ